MTWAKLDDRAHEHRKQLAAGAEACWLWACGLMYANRQRERDGFIPDVVVGMLYPLRNSRKLAARLVEVGLWEKTQGGYRIHDFHSWNPSKEQLEDERAAGRARAAKSYARNGPKKRKSSPEEFTEEYDEDLPKTEKPSGHSSGSTPTPDPLPIQLSAAASPQDLTGSHEPEPSKSDAAAAAPEETPKNLEQALRIPICQRAELAVSRSDVRDWTQPHRWPEVVAVAVTFSAASGQRQRLLSTYERDSGVKAIVALYAAGYMQRDLVRAVEAVVASAWWRSGDRQRGLSDLSPEVVARALAGPSGVDQEAARLLERAQAGAQPATKPATKPARRGGAPETIGAVVGAGGKT